jgi:nucleotidyltransferase substrate binding protein (TIGR01987 family)
MERADIRWMQRFGNYKKALIQLEEALELAKTRKLSRLEQQGLIQAFEYTFELAWNTMKDFFEDQGETGILGSRDAFRLAFKRGLIQNGEIWMDMIQSRMLTSHTYDEETADKIAADIITRYFVEYAALRGTIEALQKGPPKEV